MSKQPFTSTPPAVIPPVSPKLKQFSDELEALLARYQYRLMPIIQYLPQGSVPVVKVVDALPPPTDDVVGTVTDNKFIRAEEGEK